MKLANLDGSFFSMKVVGYEYPDHYDAFWDANWLMMQIQVQFSNHSWSVTDPCLTTFEIQRLINWLQSLSIDATYNNSLSFTENIVQFEIIGDSFENKNIRVSLRHHFRGRIETGEEDLSIDFPFSQISIDEVVLALERQLAKFPQRVFRDQIWIVISGLVESEVEIGLVKLKEEFDHQSQIIRSEMKWVSNPGFLIARVVHDYPQQLAKNEARDTVRNCVIKALNFATKLTLSISDQPVY